VFTAWIISATCAPSARRGQRMSSARRCSDFFPYDAAVRFQADDQNVIRNRQGDREPPGAVREPGRAKRWLSTTKVPLRNSEGQIIGIVGIGRDITERKVAEEQLAMYNEELREKNMQLEDDLDMASEVQQAFLPQQFPSFPRDVAPGRAPLPFYARYLPTGAVGGDFFHVCPSPPRRPACLSAMSMGPRRPGRPRDGHPAGAGRGARRPGQAAGEFLTHINQALLSILRRTRPRCLPRQFYIYLNRRHGGSALARTPAIPSRSTCGARRARSRSLAANGTPSGVRPRGLRAGELQDFHAVAKPGDLILMFTDGIFEGRGPAGITLTSSAHAAVERRVWRAGERTIEGACSTRPRLFGKHQFGDDVCSWASSAPLFIGTPRFDAGPAVGWVDNT